MNRREQALNLYKKVFYQDSDAFAKAFTYKYFDNCCRYKLCDGKIVSMLYLLDCNVRCNGKEYPAAYLYAAATDPEYRRMGFMGELIKESLKETEKSGKLLVTKPASDKLFGYYGKFGFEICSYSTESDSDIDKRFKVPVNEYLRLREKLLGDTPRINLSDMDFALNGYELYANDEFCAVFDAETQKVKEYISKTADKLSGEIPFAMWVAKAKPCRQLYFGIAMD